MQSLRQPMTEEAFRLLPMVPGWRYEYHEGMVRIRPSHRFAITTVQITPRPIATRLTIRPMTVADEPALIETFFDAFSDTVEYCDWQESAIWKSSRECIESYFDGKRGEPLPASRVVVLVRDGKEILGGAAMLVEGTTHPFLDMLFIARELQHSGAATALVGTAGNELYQLGERRLSSAYHLANEASKCWHRKFGFVEEPDLNVAEAMYRCTRHEIWRREQLGELPDSERRSLIQECERLEDLILTLRKKAERDGLESVYPSLYWK